MDAVRSYTRSLDPHLPRDVWFIQAGVFVNFFGNGLMGPFLVLYLHVARGLPLDLAAAAIATGALTAVTSGFVAGWLVDRVAANKIVAAAMTSNALAFTLYLLVREPWHAFAVAALVGVGVGMYGPSSQTLLSQLVPAADRHRAFAQNRMTSLVGIGSGGLVGGLIVATGRPSDYELLVVIDVVTFLVFALVLLAAPIRAVRSPARTTVGYRDALRDGSLRGLALLNLVLVTAGIAPMFVLLPAYLKTYPRVTEAGIGALYAIDVLVVLALQMPITRAAEGRSRMRLLAVGSALWIVAWSLLLVCGVALSDGTAAVAAAVAMVLYAIGESLYATVVIPTAAALAPDALRGRYLAVLGFSWQAGYLVGPALGGALLVAGAGMLPAAALVACFGATAGAILLGRSLPIAVRLTPRKESPKMQWVTRHDAHVDRIACPWLIKKFVDPKAEFIYVPQEEVAQVTAKGAIP